MRVKSFQITLLLALVARICLALKWSESTNLDTDYNINSNKSLQLRQNNPYICLTRLESIGCHSTGTDLSSALPNQDARCSDQGSLNNSPKIESHEHSSIAYRKQCPCKTNYSGIKCDTCIDGFHIKYTPYQSASKNHLFANEPRNNTKLTNYNRKYRPFDCIACGCDPSGSKSSICDKRNGSCFCIDGHTGAKCDKCSLGYYNVSSLAESIDQEGLIDMYKSALRPRQCVECGDCFNQWFIAIMDVREMSVDMIKRTQELSHSLTSNMGVSEDLRKDDKQDQAKLTLSGNGNSFNDLEEKIAIIGEKVLANKYNSDKLQLLAGELEHAMLYFNKSRSNLDAQRLILEGLDSSIDRLNNSFIFQVNEIDDLRRLVSDNFLKSQIAIQEGLPRGAFKLVKLNFDRSDFYNRRAIEERKKFDDEIRSKLDTQMDSYRTQKEDMDNVGLFYLPEILKKEQFDSSSYDTDLKNLIESYKYDQGITSTNGGEFNKLKWLHEMAWVSTESIMTLSKNYSSSLPSRQQEVNITIGFIEELLVIVNETESKLSQFSGEVIKTLQNSLPLSDNMNYCDIYQNDLKIINSHLKEVDSRFKSAQSDISELIKFNLTNESPDTLISTISEINRTLEDNLSFFSELADIAKSESANVVSLRRDSDSLKNVSEKLNIQLINVNQIERSSFEMIEQAKALDRKSSDEVAKFCEIFEVNIKQNNDSDTNDPNVRLRNNVASLSANLTKLEADLFVRELDKKRMIANEISRMTVINEESREVLEGLHDTYEETLSCLQHMSNNMSLNLSSSITNVTNTTIETTKRSRSASVRDRVRVADLISSYQFIVRSLYKSLSRTENLADEFKYYGKFFGSQRLVLIALHDEIDSITKDIHEKLDSYQDC